MAISRYTVFKDLASADTTNISVNDVVTGNGAGNPVGIVYTTTAAKVVVIVVSGTFAVGGETITNQLSLTCVTTSSADYAGSHPSSVVVVTGDNTASSDIFSDIAAASASGGWAIHTYPTTTDYFLYLDTMIYFGRTDQTAITSCISENEVVSLEIGATVTSNEIRVVGNSSYATTLRIGDAKYKDDDTANFPPGRVYDGITLKTYKLSARAYSVVNIYDSRFYDGGYSASFQYWSGSSGFMSRNTVYNTVQGYSFIYDSDVKIHDLRYQMNAGILISAAPSFQDVKIIMNSTGDWVFFFSGLNVEATISDIKTYDSSETVFTTCGGFVGDITLHVRNSTVSLDDTFNWFEYSGQNMLDEKSFDIKVVDWNNTAITGASIALTDKNGYSALWTDSGVNLNAQLTTSATSMTVDDTTNLVANSYYRIEAEVVQVTSIDSGTTATIIRARYGTVARQHNYPRDLWTSESSISTDSNGNITQHWVCVNYVYYSGNYVDTITSAKVYLNPFTMTISKAGYKTYTQKFQIGTNSTVPTYYNDYYKATVEMEALKEINTSRFAKLEIQ